MMYKPCDLLSRNRFVKYGTKDFTYFLNYEDLDHTMFIKLNPCVVVSMSGEGIYLICSHHPEFNIFENNIEYADLIKSDVHNMEFNINHTICKYFDLNNNEIPLNDLGSGDFVVPIIAIHGFNIVTSKMDYEIVQMKQYILHEPKLSNISMCMYKH